ncbi:MAG: DUF4430 domain-containing protein, partial [Clostridiaceae bacterium]|nr:DUF4430 domain-containing protein [Clostridiaceae bacterium]
KTKAKIILALILTFSMSLMLLSACAVGDENQAAGLESRTSRTGETVQDSETKLSESSKPDPTGSSNKTDVTKTSTGPTEISQENRTSEPASSSASRADISKTTAGTTESATAQTTAVATASGKVTVYLSVNCANLLKANVSSAADYAPDGVMLSHKEIVLDPGSTVFDALKQGGLVISASNNFLGIYVSAIQGISEGAAGAGKGGWVYSVNGVFPNYPVSSVTVEQGDEISFHYTITPGDVPGSPF